MIPETSTYRRGWRQAIIKPCRPNIGGGVVQAITLVISVLVSWALFRVIAGRATLSSGNFFAVFAVGACLSPLFSFSAERVAYMWLDMTSVTRIAAGPVDEISKAIPLLFVVLGFSRWRILTISDYALVGFAGGLGYEFLNWDLASVSGVDPWVWHRYLFGSLALPDPAVYFGGAMTTALVGTAAGISGRLTARRSTMIAWTCAAIILVTIENAMFR